ncbi:MAG: PEP-CTERM sorting domain-containing protein [Isosphaeraceae bacterium]|nr:PEP-CTERM sorting domain-containing protein [Isosphaeraceae bacterium]
MMVRSCLSSTHLRNATLAFVVATGLGARVDASPIASSVYYQTDGWVGSSNPGSSGGAVIFTGASHATNAVSLPGTISLGNFDVASLPASETLTAKDTPFHIIVSFGLQPPQGGSQSWVTSKLEINGVLNGTIVGNSQSSMVASVTSVQQLGKGALPFPLSDFQVLVPVTLTPYNQNPVKWPTTGGPFAYSLSTELDARINPVSSVPEPTTLAVLCVGIAGYAARKRYRRALA